MPQKNLVIRFLGKDSQLQRVARRVRRMFKNLGAMAKTTIQTFGKFTLATAGIGAAFAVFTMKAAEAIDRLDKMRERLKTSVGKVQLIEHAAKLGGSSLEAFAGMIEKVGRVIGKEFITPSAEVQDVLKAIGVSMDDLKGKGAVRLFEKLVPLVLKLGGSKARAAGQALFGRQFAQSLPALVNYKKNLEQANKILTDTFLLLDDRITPATVRFVDRMTDIGTILKGIVLKTVELMGPDLEKLADITSRWLQTWLKVAKVSGESIPDFLSYEIGTAMGRIVNAAARLPEIFEMLQDKLRGVKVILEVLEFLIGSVFEGARQIGRAVGATQIAIERAARSPENTAPALGKLGAGLTGLASLLGEALVKALLPSQDELEEQTSSLQELVRVTKAGSGATAQ